MRYLVTGSAGFIGSSIAVRLKELHPEADVIGVDCVTDYYDESIKRRNLERVVAAGVEVFEQDLCATDLDALLDGVDVVFHQAGQPGVRPSWGSSFGRYVRENVELTQRLLEAVKGSGAATRVVYASSSSVYGDASHYPVSEEDPTVPVSPYGVTKLAAEHLCRLYTRNFGVDTVSLRYFTVYGPGQRPDMAFNRFCDAALEGRPIDLFGDGTQIRDFTYVSDVVDANLAAAAAGHSVAGGVYNVCGGSSVTVNDVLRLLGDLRGEPLEISYGPKVPGDVFQTGGSSAKARQHLGWEPRVSVAEGLAQQFAWQRSLKAG